MAAVINCSDFLSCISLTSFGLRETSASFCRQSPYHGKLFDDNTSSRPITQPPNHHGKQSSMPSEKFVRLSRLQPIDFSSIARHADLKNYRRRPEDVSSQLAATKRIFDDYKRPHRQQKQLPKRGCLSQIVAARVDPRWEPIAVMLVLKKEE